MLNQLYWLWYAYLCINCNRTKLIKPTEKTRVLLLIIKFRWNANIGKSSRRTLKWRETIQIKSFFILVAISLHANRKTAKAVANGLVGQILAGPLFLKVKTNSILQKASNKSTRVIFGLVHVVILWYSR